MELTCPVKWKILLLFNCLLLCYNSKECMTICAQYSPKDKFPNASLHLKSSEQTESCREGSFVKILTKSSDCYKPQCLLIAAVLRIRSAE